MFKIFIKTTISENNKKGGRGARGIWGLGDLT